LTFYHFGKKLAHFFKKMLWESETLSTVKSNFYADRFANFMKNELVYDSENHEDPYLLVEPEFSSDDEGIEYGNVDNDNQEPENSDSS